MNHTRKSSALLLLIGLSMPGCQTAPMKHKPAAMVAPAPQTRAEMTQALVDQNDQFGQDVARLPGVSAEDHRQALEAVLGRLPTILQLANGAEESPKFQNSLAVITAAKTTVSDSGVERRRMEAAENEALQSAAPAFEDIGARYLFDDKDLPPLLNNLDAAVSTAAISVGPMHDLDAANAFASMQSVVNRITADMVERFPPEPAPMPGPSTEPIAPPAPEPATAPTTTPATEPATAPATAPADATTMPATAPTTSP